MKSKHDIRSNLIRHARGIAAQIGVPRELLSHVVESLHHLSTGRAPLIWIQGQGCTGCTVSFLDNNRHNPFKQPDGPLIRFQPDLMAAAGHQAIEIINETKRQSKSRYILVIEGSIPIKEYAGFCTFGLAENTEKQLVGSPVPGDKPICDWVEELSPGAAAVVAVGNCAVFGGLPADNAQVTGATAATEIVERIDNEKPLINVSGCPPHPEWFIGSVIEAMLWSNGKKGKPDLDEHKRLKAFYSTTIHEVCDRKAAFEAKLFLKDWNHTEPDLKPCMAKLGCKGPSAHGDCPTRLWNTGTNWCVGANSPCYGCTEQDFTKKLPHRIP